MGIVLSTISRCCGRAIVKLRINRGLAKEYRFASACFDKLFRLCWVYYSVLMYCILGWSEEGFRPPFGARLPHSANGGLQESFQRVVWAAGGKSPPLSWPTKWDWLCHSISCFGLEMLYVLCGTPEVWPPAILSAICCLGCCLQELSIVADQPRMTVDDGRQNRLNQVCATHPLSIQEFPTLKKGVEVYWRQG